MHIQDMQAVDVFELHQSFQFTLTNCVSIDSTSVAWTDLGQGKLREVFVAVWDCVKALISE
jgi:hypothetical protein